MEVEPLIITNEEEEEEEASLELEYVALINVMCVYIYTTMNNKLTDLTNYQNVENVTSN